MRKTKSSAAGAVCIGGLVGARLVSVRRRRQDDRERVWLLSLSQRWVRMPDETQLVSLGDCGTDQEIWAFVGPHGARKRRLVVLTIGQDIVVVNELPARLGTPESISTAIERHEDVFAMVGEYQLSDLGPRLGSFAADADVVDELVRLLGAGTRT